MSMYSILGNSFFNSNDVGLWMGPRWPQWPCGGQGSSMAGCCCLPACLSVVAIFHGRRANDGGFGDNVRTLSDQTVVVQRAVELEGDHRYRENDTGCTQRRKRHIYLKPLVPSLGFLTCRRSKARHTTKEAGAGSSESTSGKQERECLSDGSSRESSR